MQHAAAPQPQAPAPAPGLQREMQPRGATLQPLSVLRVGAAGPVAPGAGTPRPAQMLQMQRLVGNRHTGRMTNRPTPAAPAAVPVERTAEPVSALVQPAPATGTLPLQRSGNVDRDGDGDGDWDILGGIRRRIEGLVDGLRAGWGQVSSLASTSFDGFTGALDSATQGLSGAVGTVVADAQAGWLAATTEVTTLTAGVREQLGGWVAGITGAGAAVRAGVARMDAAAIAGAWVRLQGMVDGVWTGMQRAQAAVTQRISALWDDLSADFESAWGAASAQFDALYQGLAEQAGALRERIEGAWQSVLDQASVLGGIGEGVASVLQSVVDQLMSWAENIWDDIRAQWSAIAGRLDGLLEEARDRIGTVWDAVGEMASSVWAGLESGWSALAAWAGEQMATLAGGVESLWQRIGGVSIDGLLDRIAAYSRFVGLSERAVGNADAMLDELAAPVVAQLQAGMPEQARTIGQEHMASAQAQLQGPASGGDTAVMRSPAAHVQRQERSVMPPDRLWSGFWYALGEKWDQLQVSELVKHVFWTLLWPWPTVGKELSALWDDWTHAAGDLFSGRNLLDDPLGALHDLWSNVLALLDFPIALWRRINNVVMALMGWVTIALTVLGAVGGTVAGTVIGAIAGAVAGLGVGAAPGTAGGAGAGGLAGAGGGFGVALALGELFVISFALAEGASLTKMILDLLTARQTPAQKERDFNQASDSFLGLGILAVLLALAWLGGRIAAAAAPLLKKVPLPRSWMGAGEDFAGGVRSTRPGPRTGSGRRRAEDERQPPGDRPPVDADGNRYVDVTRENLRARDAEFDGGSWEFKLYDAESGASFCRVEAEAPNAQVTPPDGPHLTLRPHDARTPAGEVVNLQARNFSWTRESLNRAMQWYRSRWGSRPPNMSGRIAWDNLANFQRAYSRIRDTNPRLSPSKIGRLAARDISFGRHRIQLEYGDLSARMDLWGDVTLEGGQILTDVPRSVYIDALPTPLPPGHAASGVVASGSESREEPD